MIIATAGHIDHGKTTLVAALTGVATDRLPEEKSRGLTIDLGFAYEPVEDGPVLGFVDVPGHERFVKNMLAGVSGIDFALLVIAADDGIMAQTEEHLAILDLLNVNKGAVALSKADAVEPARLDDVEASIRSLIENSTLKGAPIFRVSGLTGEGIPELKTFLEQQARSHKSRDQSGNFRLAVDRCFSMTGAGLIVTGTAFSGTIDVGDQLMIAPQGLPVRVRALHAQNIKGEHGQAGQRLGVNLTGPGLKKTDVHRGDWLLDPALATPTQRLDCRIRFLASEKRSLKHWTPVHLHLGAKEVTGHVAVLEGKPLSPGERGLVQLVLDKEICAVHGDRLVLRDSSAQRTIGGGRVLDPFGWPRGRSRPERIEILRILERNSPHEILPDLLEHSPSGVSLNRFAEMMNLDSESLAVLLEQTDHVLAGADEDNVAFSKPHWDALQDRALELVKQVQRDSPGEPGIPEDLLRRRIKPRLSAAVYRSLVSALLEVQALSRNGSHLCTPDHRIEMSTADQALWARIEPLLQEDGFRPPVIHDIAEVVGQAPKSVAGFLARAEKFGLVCKVADNRFFLPHEVRELANIVEVLITTSGKQEMSVVAFRDAAEIGRNLAVQVLEYFDKRGLTARKDNARRLLKPVAEIFGHEETG